MSSFGIGISMNRGWVVLSGDDRFGECAQQILRSDTSLVAPIEYVKPKPFDPESWNKTTIPLVKQSWPDTDILSAIVGVQPMTDPNINSFIKWEYIDEKESELRKQETLDWFKKDLAEGEILKKYAYGGPLAERGGWFVVHENEPNLVRRYCQTWMS